MNRYGAKVGVHADERTQSQEPGLRTPTSRGIRQAGRADRAEQDSIGVEDAVPGACWQGITALCDRRRSDWILWKIQLKSKQVPHGAQDRDSLGSHFRSDTVTGKHGYSKGRHVWSSSRCPSSVAMRSSCNNVLPIPSRPSSNISRRYGAISNVA